MRFQNTIIILFFIFIGCNYTNEYNPIEIKLSEEFSIKDAEYSGLVFANEELLLLPQFPNRFSGHMGGNILSIPKEKIEHYILDKIKEPIKPRKIGFNDDGISKTISGFEGFEAIVVVGDSVYLTIEAKEGEGRFGYIVWGKADWEKGEIHLDQSSVKKIQSNLFMSQMSFESLVKWNNFLVAIYEANGLEITHSPQAIVFDLELNQLYNIPIPNIEYRLTDATSISKDGFFWVINYFYPEEHRLKPAIDPIAERFGKGETHAKENTVERLVQFSFKNGKMIFGPKPPVQLSLNAGIARNWEGIEILDNYGFLIISDTHPRSLFSFVPFEFR
tara:strand:+ start:8824 stop:9819 length:996 start_codon:yes stop_codon:yes gene_type:complete